jgi:hypothetical protein
MKSDGALVLPWRRIAFGCALITIASLATLVVVTAVRQPDALSTVALALAILAFGAQLAIAIVQGQAFAEQRARFEEINADTRALLADLRATTGGVLTTVQSQFETVLRHALGEAIPEAVGESVEGGGPFDPEQFERRLLAKLEQTLERATATTVVSVAGPTRGTGAPPPVTTGAEQLGLRPGDRVSHRKWGLGEVVKLGYMGKDRDPTAEIRFDTVGTKELLLPWTPLELVERSAANDSSPQRGGDD